MAIQMFKAGKGHEVNGIECRMGIFNEYSYLHLLDQGWHYTPEECYAVQEKKQEEIEPEETAEEEAGATEEGVLNLEDEIRERAKNSGIAHYWMKSIPNLKEELKELSNVEHGAERRHHK